MKVCIIRNKEQSLILYKEIYFKIFRNYVYKTECRFQVE